MVQGPGSQPVRGSHVGATSSHEVERGETVARQGASYYCSRGHRSVLAFAADAQVPPLWDCPRCGLPASLDPADPPAPRQVQPYKTHLAYLKERRSEAEAADLLEEALRLLRRRRRSGELLP